MLVPQVLGTWVRLGNTSKATPGWVPGGWRSDLESQSGPWGLELRSWPLELQPGAEEPRNRVCDNISQRSS